MKNMTRQLLTLPVVALAFCPAFAQAADAPKLLNATAAPAVAATSVTAPAIAWPVVRAPAKAEIVHIAPGSTATLAPDPSTVTAAVTPPPPPPPAEPTLTVDINLSTQRMTVSENGMAKFTWPISSARAGYRTPTGTYKPTWMSKMWYSRQYDMAPMPHAVFFSGGVAIHATYATGMLGNPASHGCVRLAPKNAATFYSLVNRHGKNLTRISVHGVPRSNGPAMASNRRKGPLRYAYVNGRYTVVQGGGYAVSAYASPYGQQAQFAPKYGVQVSAKRQKFAQGAQVTRTSGNGFGYGFGGF